MRFSALGLASCILFSATAGAAPLVGGVASPTGLGPEIVAETGGRTLAPASPLAPEAAARAFLLRGVAGSLPAIGEDLALVAVTPLSDGGSLVRLQQRVGGLDVVGAQVTVRLRADRAVLWTMSALVAPRTLGGEQRLSPLEAVDYAYLDYAPGRRGELTDARMARLVAVKLPGGELRRAYQVTLPTRAELLSALRCLVDAEDGSGLGVENAVRTTGQARVFDIDPAISGDATLQPVSHVPAGSMFLDDGVVRGENCVDQHNRVAVSTGAGTDQIHICSEVQSAAVDPASGDWAYAAVTGTTGVDKTGGGDGTTPSEVDSFDRFAEVSMYYQVRKAYDAFKQLLTQPTLIRQQPIPAIANFRMSFGGTGSFQQQLVDAENPNGPMYPFDNAAYIPRGPIVPGVPRDYDSMVFGQGTYVDFAYDGLTVYHEFTHAVIDSSIGLRVDRLDRWGLDNAPSAMNEGYADFFAGAISGHANLDAYLGPAFDMMGIERRTLDNLNVCPANLQGEPHHDSMPWSASLWAARVALGTTPERQHAYDLAAFRALSGLTQQPSFDAAATATIAELGNDPMFTSADVNLARTKFSDRGQIACERVVHYQQPVSLMFMEGLSTADSTAHPYMPGYFQWRFDVTDPAQGLDVIVETATATAAGALQPRVLVKRGADPIQFTYSSSTVTGNDDADLVTPMTVQGQGFVAHVVGNFSPGPVHLMIVNTGTSGAELQNVEIQAVPGTIFMDAAVAADAAPPSPDAAVKPPGGGGGCGCQAGGGTGARGTLLVLGLLGLALARRRG